MAGIRDVKSRLGAARLVLDEPMDAGTRTMVSEVQSNAMASLLATATLTDVEKADLAPLVCQVKWALPEHTQHVLSGLMQNKTTAATELPVAKKHRRGLQEFTALHGYINENTWADLKSNIPVTSKLQLLLQVAQRLGMRLPSEHTSKWLTCLWLYLSYSERELLQMTPQHKVGYLKHAKSTFDTIRRSLVDPPMWIDRLPTEPAEYAKLYPPMFAAVYATENTPIVAPIDIAQVITLSQSFGCRGGGTRTALPVSPGTNVFTPAVESIQASPRRDAATNSLERMANMFMQQMQSMSAQQNRMMELMISGGTTRPHNLKSLTSVQEMAFLEDRPRVAQPRAVQPAPALQMLLPPPSETSTPNFERRPTIPAISPPPIASPTASHVAFPVPAVPHPDEMGSAHVAGEKVSSPVADEVDPIGMMLDAIMDRKKEKSAAAKSEKAAAAKVDEVTTKATPMKKATGKVAAKGKAKVAAKAKGKVAAKAKAVATELDAPPKVDGSAAASVAKAKAAAVVKAMSPKDRRIAKAKCEKSPVTLGCGKCRFSYHGCGQCKSEAFTGIRWNAFCEA